MATFMNGNKVSEQVAMGVGNVILIAGRKAAAPPLPAVARRSGLATSLRVIFPTSSSCGGATGPDIRTYLLN